MGKAAGSAGELGWGISVFGITAWKCWPGVFLEPKVLGSRCFGVSWKCLVALCVLFVCLQGGFVCHVGAVGALWVLVAGCWWHPGACLVAPCVVLCMWVSLL